MFIACAELFPAHGNANGEELWRGVAQGMANESKLFAHRMLTFERPTGVVVIFDGRGKQLRTEIRTMPVEQKTEFIELWIVYDGELQFASDVRNPRRKLAWGGAHMEMLFVV